MCFTLRLHMSAAPPQGGLTQALAVMPSVTCPHCGKVPGLGLFRFLPGWSLVRHEFVCSLCSGVSEFSGSSKAWSVAEMVTGIAVVGLAIRVSMTMLDTHRIPMSTLGAVASFAAIVGIAQVASALMLRRKAVLIPVRSNGS